MHVSGGGALVGRGADVLPGAVLQVVRRLVRRRRGVAVMTAAKLEAVGRIGAGRDGGPLALRTFTS